MDPKDDATKQACTHVFQSALRQYRYHLRKSHFEGKANNEIAQHLQWNILQMKNGQPSLNTGLIQSIR